ncbi:hypothetical protein AT05_10140 [Schleiferia thermophila str. Yellowstone]|nr:hypothetical protein AT05_10140 [Schleiferia thermophila str. Yellowstone]
MNHQAALCSCTSDAFVVLNFSLMLPPQKEAAFFIPVQDFADLES